MNKEKLRAVHDKDLEILLEKLAIVSKLKHKKLKCSICKTVITFENLHSIFPRSGSIKLICDNTECIKELTNLIRDGKVTI